VAHGFLEVALEVVLFALLVLLEPFHSHRRHLLRFSEMLSAVLVF
jgi:hypothetical protein